MCTAPVHGVAGRQSYGTQHALTQSDEDYCYFHVLCPSLRATTVFGISCNRQIQSDVLINRGAQVTRSMVQKAIVILAMQPIFGPLRTKLGMVTRAFFAQRDLSNVSLLEEFYGTLESGLRRAPPSGGAPASLVDGSNTLYMGTSIRECVYKWRFRTLLLLKLLLLQRRVMVYGYPVELLCTLQYSLVSLVPALLPNLQDAASPGLDTLAHGRIKADSLRMSDRQSVLAYMGMPLPLFSGGAFFQPYCPLQQIDELQCDSWLIGTTNQIFQHQAATQPDVIVDVRRRRRTTDAARENAGHIRESRAAVCRGAHARRPQVDGWDHQRRAVDVEQR